MVWSCTTHDCCYYYSIDRMYYYCSCIVLSNIRRRSILFIDEMIDMEVYMEAYCT